MTEHFSLRSGSPVRQVVALAWPVLAQQVLLFGVGVYDRYLAGANAPADLSRHVAAQAAQTNTGYMLWFIQNSTLLISVGSTALVARHVGARTPESAGRALHQSLLLAVILGVIASVLGLSILRPVVGWLGLSGAAATEAVDFLVPILALLTFQMIEQAGVACLVGAGDTKTGPLISGLVAVLNIPLAWSLFHGWGPIPELGFRGIGCGTALSHVLGAIVVLAVLARGRYGLKLSRTRLIPDLPTMYRLLRISIPAAIDGLSVCAGQFWFLSLVNRIGDDSSRNFIITAHGHAIQWEAMGYLSGHAFGVAAMALVGQNLGARRPTDAARSGWTALRLAAICMSVMGAIFFVFAVPMFRLFSPGEHQQPVIDLGVPVLRLVAFAMPALACTNVLTSALRGAGDTRRPVLITWAGFLLVRIPLAYVLTGPVIDAGLFGAWIAMFADLHVRGALFLLRFSLGRWKEINV